MSKKSKILTIIGARAGSKGILNKNIRKFHGKPLISYTIKQALNLKNKGLLDRVIVSTEDNKIASISKKCGAEVPFMRPIEFSQDNSNITDAIIHTLNRLKEDEKYIPDYIILLQPPSPIREEEDIIKCIDKIKTEKSTNAIVTVCPTHSLFYQLNKGDTLNLINKKDFNTANRQSMPNGYKLNGCFVYIIKYNVLMKEKTFFPKNTKAVVCDAWRSIDLDEPEDWALAEVVYKNKDKIKNKIEKLNKEKNK